MEETSGKSADLWSGLAFAALGIYIIARASGWEYLGPEGPGPGFFPMWYGVAMVGLSAWLVVASVRRKAAAGAPVAWRSVGRALLAWLAFAVSVALFKLLGFTVSFGLLCFFL